MRYSQVMIGKLISEKYGITQTLSKFAMKIVGETLRDILSENDSVVLQSVGTLRVVNCKERMGTNPYAKNTPIKIAAQRRIAIKTSKEMKTLINKKIDVK